MKINSDKKISLEMDTNEANLLKECLRKFSAKEKEHPFAEFANEVQGELDKELCRKI